jgi:hypothetical protein
MKFIVRSMLVALVPMFLTFGVGTAMATETSTWLCVPETSGQTVTSGGSEGTCAAKNTKVELPPTAELATLQSILPHIKYEASGVAGKPTIQFNAVNVQVVSGSGKTYGAVNGEGNLVIGYDENEGKHEQTGSHNLILGREQTFTGYGGIVAGFKNTNDGSYNSVTGGEDNTVRLSYNSVSGGEENTAIGNGNSITGGRKNTVNGVVGWNSVSGGIENTASGIEGGNSVSGGEKNSASGSVGRSWVGGGYKDTASGAFASIFGGKDLVAEKEYEAIP